MELSIRISPMGRPRLASDEEVFEAVDRVVAGGGPGALTLSAIGGVAGITAGALVQRFGARDELLVAYTTNRRADLAAMFERRGRTAVATLREGLAAVVPVSTAGRNGACNTLAFKLDHQDARRELRDEMRTVERHIRDLVAQGISEGELSGAAPQQLSRVVV